MSPPFLISVAARSLRLNPWVRYAAGAGLAALVLALRLSLDRFLVSESPFLLSYPAVVLAALYLGRGPALLCLALCTANVAYFEKPPTGWFDLAQPVDITDLALFVVIAAGLALLLVSQRRAQASAEAAQLDAQEHARRLEVEIAERQRAETALKRSNDDLEDYAHIVSHDLKEPLRGISTTAGFLIEDFGDKLGVEGRGKLETLVRLPQRMSALLDALLEYASVGRAELAMKRTDLASVVAEVCERLRTWLDERHAQVEVETPLPEALCDRARVGQVFANLIANGVKYNESPEPRVQVGARREGPVAVYYVRDNGIGIAPRHAARMFRMFSRLHGRERYGGGTGSGLALAKKTVERHGGRIWFESSPGQGTTFFFTLGPGLAERRTGTAA
jgi:two-component system, chemotaxis family, sensor kinase Cph1